MTEAAHEDGVLYEDLTVKQIMDTWTLQMGYPVLTVQRFDSSLQVTQVSLKTTHKINVFQYKFIFP